MRMLADFVSKRGGGLLMLGGRRSFAEGGWAGTPVAEVLPGRARESGREDRLASRRILRTCARRAPAPVSGHADCRRRSGVGDQVERDADGHDRQPVYAVKPGATVLLIGIDNGRQDQVVLACPALRTRQGARDADSGFLLWHMDAKIAGHRHDARDVLAPAGALAGRRRPEPGERDDDRGSRRAGRTDEVVRRGARLRVRRSERQPRRRATSRRRPARRASCRWNGPSTHDGEYTAASFPTKPGIYEVKVTRDARIRRRSARAASTSACRPATPNTSTRRCAHRCCNRIAEETGGRFFTPANAARCPKPSATAAAASPSSKSAISGTCRSC